MAFWETLEAPHHVGLKVHVTICDEGKRNRDIVKTSVAEDLVSVASATLEEAAS